MNGVDFKELKINKLFLSSGEPLKVTSKVTVIHPTIQDIVKIGNGLFCEDLYWSYVGVINADPYNQMVWLDKRGINYQKVTPFDVFILKWLEAAKEGSDDSIELMKKSLDFFIEGDHDFVLVPVKDKEKGGFVIVDVNDTDCVLNKDIFNLVSFFVTKINNITDSGRINPKGEGERKLLISQKRAEERRREKNQQRERFENIGDAVMTTIWGGGGGIDINNYVKAPVYMLTSGSNITLKKQNYELVMSGVYAGTVKYSSIKSDVEGWMK